VVANGGVLAQPDEVVPDFMASVARCRQIGSHNSRGQPAVGGQSTYTYRADSRSGQAVSGALQPVKRLAHAAPRPRGLRRSGPLVDLDALRTRCTRGT